MDRSLLQQHLLHRAASDAGFRAQLLADPKEAIARESGLEIPSHTTVKILEESSDRLCLVLPVASGELSDLELEAVAGGSPSGPLAGTDTRTGGIRL